jgi:glycosyltransferase involved in cell wall biosynthesis
MRLLIITQTVDKKDPVLGFFHRWLEEFSKNYEKVTVICLGKGEFNLPSNVSVYSLGKEEGASQLTYLYRFFKYIWALRRDYDAVFVHMNQEYVLLGYKHWLFMGKRVYMWRNHAKGTLLTQLAVLLSKRVFCTSPQSYTARFKKTLIMPVGIDTEFFRPNEALERIPNSILFLGRISPVKRVKEFVKWFNELDPKHTATIAGEALLKDRAYGAEVKALASERIKFVGPVTQDEALRLYQSHEIYVNKTPAGSFDKTIFEAAACGTKLLLDNEDLKSLENKSREELREYVVNHHSLKLLMEKLSQVIK